MKKKHTLNLRRSTRAPHSTAASSSKATRKSGSSNSSSGRFNLKWNLQSQHILNELGKIYFSGEEDEPETTDVSLFSSDGDCVQAHKIVLMLCCPYFKNMFLQVSKTRRKEGDNAIVVLGNVSSSQLRNLVRFMYTGEVDSTSSQEKEEFIKIAKQFGIEGLSSTSNSKSTPTSKTLLFKITDKTSASRKENPAEPVAIPQAPESKDNDIINVIDASLAQEDAVGCKVEPSDDLNNYDDDHEDFDPPPDADDDAGSNFSDHLQDAMASSDDEEDKRKDPDVSFGEAKKRKRDLNAEDSSEAGGGKLNWRTGRITGWMRIDPLSEEELKRDWRRHKQQKYKGSMAQIFYCPYAKKYSCPATLKIKTLIDGTDLYFKNNYPHANHRAPDDKFGLTKEHKAFIEECLQNGITQPSNILIKCEVAGIGKIPRNKLCNYVQRLKKIPEWGAFWTKKEPKWPRRIRKKPERTTGLPKRVGRPTNDEVKKRTSTTVVASPSSSFSVPVGNSTTIDSASSSPTPHSSQGFLPHPNHFPGGIPFPIGIPPSGQHVHPSQFPFETNFR